MKRAPAWLVPVGLTLALSACGGGMADLERYVAEVKARKSTKIEPIPQIKRYEAFAYIPGERPDPFMPPLPESARNFGGDPSLRPDLNRNKEPLEEFPLDALQMIGTIEMSSRMYALVKAPDGVIHRVTRGNHMGQNYGEIVAIQESGITLREIVPDGFGSWMQRPASLALSE